MAGPRFHAHYDPASSVAGDRRWRGEAEAEADDVTLVIVDVVGP